MVSRIPRKYPAIFPIRPFSRSFSSRNSRFSAGLSQISPAEAQKDNTNPASPIFRGFISKITRNAAASRVLPSEKRPATGAPCKTANMMAARATEGEKPIRSPEPTTHASVTTEEATAPTRRFSSPDTARAISVMCSPEMASR